MPDPKPYPLNVVALKFYDQFGEMVYSNFDPIRINEDGEGEGDISAPTHILCSVDRIEEVLE